MSSENDDIPPSPTPLQAARAHLQVALGLLDAAAPEQAAAEITAALAALAGPAAPPAQAAVGQGREADLLLAIFAAAAGEDDLGRMLGVVLQQLGDHIAFTGGSIALVEGDELVIRAAVGLFAATAIGQRVRRGGVSWQVIESAAPQLIDDVQASGGRPSTPFRSYLAVPLAWRGQTFGLLEVDSVRPQAFGASDLALLQRVAAALSGSIELARLYQSVREALALREMFLVVASHELRTPLTGLLGYAQMLQRRTQRTGTLDERDQRALRQIIAQGKRLQQLIAALLDISRIQAGRLSIERGQIDLCDLLRRMVDELAPTLERHQIELRCSEPQLWMSGDALRLEQVFQNLLHNAVKYSPAGGTVAVSVERAGALARIVVADQGIGIPEAEIQQLFQRFVRASNTGAHGIDGLGIGLFVVGEIVALHGGTVTVESVEGQGSAFAVLLPLTESAALAV